MYSRRSFLGTFGKAVPAAAALITLEPLGVNQALEAIAGYNAPPPEAASDEDFWINIQRAFTVDRSIINLNNGGVSPSPAFVQAAMKRHLDFSNNAPAHTMWRILEPQREGVRKRLANMFRCSSEEIALTRNASEGLQICQMGFDFEPGDEVLTTDQDYPRMLNTFRQQERRDGIKLVQFAIPTPAEHPSEIVALYEKHITSKTRLILVSHMINITGQVLPVKEIVEMARKHKIPAIVDGAHSFAHFDFDHSDLDCDYFATSLHKWLFAPHGTGMLYVRKPLIKNLWAMTPGDIEMDNDVRKFEEIGTHPAANYLAIAEALTFNEGIGLARKAARLAYLRDYWARRLMEFDRLRLHTSLQPGLAYGIATMEIEGIDCRDLKNYLWRKQRIIVTPIEHQQFQGIRVSPSVYTTLTEIDRFCEEIEQVLKNGIRKI